MEAIAGTAIIRASDARQDASGSADSGEPIFGLLPVLNQFGKRTYRFVLEVRLPEREPYRVEGAFKVPRKVENTGLLTVTKLQPGIVLPVRVDARDPQAVTIDWDAYLAAPDRKAMQRGASHDASNARIAELTAKKPKLQARMIANNRRAVEGWAEAVRLGSMTRAAFEEAVRTELACGRMDPADAERARATLPAEKA